MAEKPIFELGQMVRMVPDQWYNTTGQVLAHMHFIDGTVGYWVSFPYTHAAGQVGANRNALTKYELRAAEENE